MKSTILRFKTQKEHNHMLTCLHETDLTYRLQTSLTGINDIEVYHNSKTDITKLNKLYNSKLQISIF